MSDPSGLLLVELCAQEVPGLMSLQYWPKLVSLRIIQQYQLLLFNTENSLELKSEERFLESLFVRWWNEMPAFSANFSEQSFDVGPSLVY